MVVVDSIILFPFPGKDLRQQVFLLCSNSLWLTLHPSHVVTLFCSVFPLSLEPSKLGLALEADHHNSAPDVLLNLSHLWFAA
jgi:hypothetical protein